MSVFSLIYSHFATLSSFWTCNNDVCWICPQSVKWLKGSRLHALAGGPAKNLRDHCANSNYVFVWFSHLYFRSQLIWIYTAKQGISGFSRTRVNQNWGTWLSWQVPSVLLFFWQGEITEFYPFFFVVCLVLLDTLVIQIARFGGSVGCAVWLKTRRSRVQPLPRSATFFRGDWSWNIFYGHSFLLLIQEGQLSVSGERMCTILVNKGLSLLNIRVIR